MQEEIDDQAGFFVLMLSSHLSLPSHGGKFLEDCPFYMFLKPEKREPGSPSLTSYRMAFLDFSEETVTYQ